MKGFGDIMKQMQKLQSKFEEIQKELEAIRVEGSAGGGVVKVIANGKQDIVEIKIEKEVVNPEDVEMLQDLVLAAVNQAKQKAQEIASEHMAKLTGGLKIPGFPF